MNQNKENYKFVQIEVMEALVDELNALLEQEKNNDAKIRLEEILEEHNCDHVDNLRSIVDEESTGKNGRLYGTGKPGKLEWTLLHVAAFADKAKLCAFLIKQNANPNSLTDKLETPLHTAVESLAYESVKYLLSRNDVNKEAKAKYTALDPITSRTPLIVACGKASHKSFDIIKLLVEKGCNIYAKTYRSALGYEGKPYQTLVHLLICNAYKSYRFSESEKNKESIKSNLAKTREAINFILKNIKKEKLNEFLESKTKYTQKPDLDWMTTLEFASQYLEVEQGIGIEVNNFWRNIRTDLISYGAKLPEKTILAKEVCDINRKADQIKKNTEKTQKLEVKVVQNPEKTNLKIGFEYISVGIGVLTGTFGLYEVILHNHKKSKQFCLACAFMTVALISLAIFGTSRIFGEKNNSNITNPEVEDVHNKINSVS